MSGEPPPPPPPEDADVMLLQRRILEGKARQYDQPAVLLRDTEEDVERLALYLHQSRHSNDDPEYDMDVARERVARIIERLRKRLEQRGLHYEATIMDKALAAAHRVGIADALRYYGFEPTGESITAVEHNDRDE